jgi:acyl transferase domain-containing protein
LTLSGKNEQALFDLAERYEAYLSAHPDVELADLCYTANTGRAHFEHRLAAVAESCDELREQLSAFVAGEAAIGLVSGSLTLSRPKACADAGSIAFLFTGGGAQYVGMGRELYETEPIFHQTVTYCDRILRPYLEKPLLEVLYPADEATNVQAIHEMGYMQPALFVIEYALAKLWQSWGIQPDIVMGHSTGEYVAACLAGVFSLQDGLKLITKRGQLMESTLNITCASHSPVITLVLAEFEQATREVTFDAPQIPVVSNVMGAIADERLTTSEYWCRHLRETVRFADGMKTLHQQGINLFIEVRPKPILLGIARNSYHSQDGLSNRQEKLWLPSLRPNYSDWLSLQQSLAELVSEGGIL